MRVEGASPSWRHVQSPQENNFTKKSSRRRAGKGDMENFMGNHLKEGTGRRERGREARGARRAMDGHACTEALGTETGKAPSRPQPAF